MACRVFAQWGADPRETAANARETVANNLAGRLLLPTAWFAADAAACGWDLLALKARYRTASHELIARRMLECRPPVIISIFDQRRIFVSPQQSSRPDAAAVDRPKSVLARRSLWPSHPLRTRHGPGLVQGWPIHEEAGSGRSCGRRSTSGPMEAAGEG